MTNIRHLNSRKLEIQLSPSKMPIEEKLEHLIWIACQHNAEHAYRQSTSTLSIECKTDEDMKTITEEIKNYLRKG